MQQTRENRLSLHDRLSYTTKDAAVVLLARHRAAKTDKPKDALKKIEATKKVGRVLFKAKNTSLAMMSRMEGKIDGKTIIGVLDTGATSSVVTRSFVTMLQVEGHLVSIQKMSAPLKYKLAHDVLDSNGTETGETESEDFEITELCRLSPDWALPHWTTLHAQYQLSNHESLHARRSVDHRTTLAQKDGARPGAYHR
jgi:hypothetical protein